MGNNFNFDKNEKISTEELRNKFESVAKDGSISQKNTFTFLKTFCKQFKINFSGKNCKNSFQSVDPFNKGLNFEQFKQQFLNIIKNSNKGEVSLSSTMQECKHKKKIEKLKKLKK